MNDIYDRLVKRLLEKNDFLSYHQAKVWIEILWEDFEVTRAKAGFEYEGKPVTEKIVNKWIDSYGSQLHHFKNPKYNHLLNTSNYLKH